MGPEPDWALIRRLLRALEREAGGAMRRQDLHRVLGISERRALTTVLWPAYAKKLIDFCGRDWVVLSPRAVLGG
jgi:hypothetical protein